MYTAWPELAPDSAKPNGLLMVRRLDRDETAVIEGTEGAREAAVSPDGRWVAFASAKDRAGSSFSLKKVALVDGRPTGKPETVLETLEGSSPNLCSASDREIVFAPSLEPTIYAVSAAGGEARVVVREDLPKGIEGWEDFRPLVAGQSILATRFSLAGQTIKVNTYVIELASGKPTLVLPNAGSAQYVPDGDRGYLLAMKSARTSLSAVRFDRGSARTIGEPVTVWSGNPIDAFGVSASGTLAMTTQSPDVSDRRLAWIDEKGQPRPVPGATRNYGQLAVSPVGERVVVQLSPRGSADLTSDLEVHDLARRSFTRIPVQGGLIGMTWSSDGQRITHGLASEGVFSIRERRSDGTGDPVTLYASPDGRALLGPTRWSPDGRILAMAQVDVSTEDVDTYLLRQETGDDRQDKRQPVEAEIGRAEIQHLVDAAARVVQQRQREIVASSLGRRPIRLREDCCAASITFVCGRSNCRRAGRRAGPRRRARGADAGGREAGRPAAPLDRRDHGADPGRVTCRPRWSTATSSSTS